MCLVYHPRILLSDKLTENTAVSTSVSCYISALNISDSKTKHAARDPKPVYDKVGE